MLSDRAHRPDFQNQILKLLKKRDVLAKRVFCQNKGGFFNLSSLFICSGPKYRLYTNLNKISIVAGALAFCPHEYNKIHTDTLFKFYSTIFSIWTLKTQNIFFHNHYTFFIHSAYRLGRKTFNNNSTIAEVLLKV